MYLIIYLYVTEKSTLKWQVTKRLLWCVTENATLICHLKGHDDRGWITEKASLTWTENATLTWNLDGWWITKKATLMCHWKDYDDVSLKMLRWRVADHRTCYYDVNWNGYPNKSLKMLFWRVTENAMMTGDGSLKMLLWRELKRLP
jgi:hypothetical protein